MLDDAEDVDSPEEVRERFPSAKTAAVNVALIALERGTRARPAVRCCLQTPALTAISNDLHARTGAENSIYTTAPHRYEMNCIAAAAVVAAAAAVVVVADSIVARMH